MSSLPSDSIVMTRSCSLPLEGCALEIQGNATCGPPGVQPVAPDGMTNPATSTTSMAAPKAAAKACRKCGSPMITPSAFRNHGVHDLAAPLRDKARAVLLLQAFDAGK